ncbi:hypothetical protein Tco_0969625 [Tanacetum coccineum]
MYNKKNVDYVALLWEDFMYQADNREISLARKEHMPYPRFTKVMINHFISKDKTISMRDRINLHIIPDDSLLGTLKFVSNTQDCQQFGALIPDDMVNQDVKDSKAYKTYYDFATGKTTPKKARKFKKVASSLRKLSPVLEEEPAEKPKRAKNPAKKSTTVPTTGVAIRDTPSESVSKKKTPAKVDRDKGMDLLSDVALLEAAQIKKTLKKSRLVLCDDDDNNDVSDEVTKDDDEDDVEKEEKEEEYVRTPDNFKFNNDDEEYEELYTNVNVRLTYTEHEEQGKEDEEITDAGRDDEHVTLTTVHDTQKTEGLMQSSLVSSDFANQFLNLDNVPPTDTEVISMINFKVRHEEPSTQIPPILNIPVTVIPETSIADGPTISPTIPPITSLQQQLAPTPTPAPTTVTTATSGPALPDFSSMFGFDQRVSTLEKELSQLKQANYSRQLLKSIMSQIPAMVDAQISTRLKDSIKKSFRSYTTEFEKKAKDERKRYIDLVENTIHESLENVVLDKSSSQLQSTYEAASSLTEFELKKILLDKLEKSKSYRAVEQHRDLYDALVKSYQLDKDLFDSYGKAYSLKRGREDKYKDEDPPAGSDQGLKKKKTSKDAKPPKGSKSKESKSSSSKGTKSQSKTSGKSVQIEEPVFETADTEMPQDQGGDLGNTENQPNVEEASKHDWFKKPESPPTLDRDWNASKQIDFRPPQTWISKIARAGKPPTTFDELMSTPIDFSVYVLNNLKIKNLT